MHTDTFKFWNEEKKAWVDTYVEATDLGHGTTKVTKPKNSIRVSDLGLNFKSNEKKD